MQMTLLAYNPICRAYHYENYFGVSESTAQRMLREDKKEMAKKRITFLDFYNFYEAFPDKNFRPIWFSISCPHFPSKNIKTVKTGKLA